MVIINTKKGLLDILILDGFWLSQINNYQARGDHRTFATPHSCLAVTLLNTCCIRYFTIISLMQYTISVILFIDAGHLKVGDCTDIFVCQYDYYF
jgi:hypothetical protein